MTAPMEGAWWVEGAHKVVGPQHLHHLGRMLGGVWGPQHPYYPWRVLSGVRGPWEGDDSTHGGFLVG